MNQHEEVFLSVLRSALWGHPVQVPDGFNDWGAVMKLANMQAVNGLVWDVMVTNQKIKASIPEQAVAAMRDIPKNNLSMHTKLNNALILVVTVLREHGIKPVLLKGQGLARCYPVPELRQCGDIDLYVGLDDYEKAYDVLKPIVSDIDEKDRIWEGDKHFHANIGSVLIEIHRFAYVVKDVTLDRVYQSYAEVGLKNNLVSLDFGGVSVNTPADNFNVYYVFKHLWHHCVTSGVGLRQLCDLAVFLNSHDIDKTYLKQILSDMKDMRPWQTFGCVLVDYLGLAEDRFPFYNPRKHHKGELLLKLIFSDGNFGHYRNSSREKRYGYFREKMISLNLIILHHFERFRIFPYYKNYKFWKIIKSGISQVLKDPTAKLRR